MNNELEHAIIFLSLPCKCGNLPVIQYNYENKTIHLKCCVFKTPEIKYTEASGEMLAKTLSEFWNKQQRDYVTTKNQRTEFSKSL
jgi:hypothetical protein